MASVVQRRSKSGTTSFQLRWRDPDVAQQQSVTFVSEIDAKLLKRVPRQEWLIVWHGPESNGVQ